MNEFKSFFKTVGGAEGNKCYYPTRLDTYGRGCFYDCKYCYSRQLLDFRKLWNPKHVGVTPFWDILKTVKTIPKGSVIRLGGMTDCFQPIERIHKNTYNLIKILNLRRIHYLIVTKSDLISTERYMNILDEDLAHIQVSIPSTDDKVLSATDNAPSFSKRRNTVETLFDNGFDVSVRLSPFFFDTSDFSIINDIKVDKCLVEFLRVKPNMKKDLKDFINFREYSHKEGGYQHLPLSKKVKILKKLNFKELTVCDDVQSHYDYFKKNINFNRYDCCNLRLK